MNALRTLKITILMLSLFLLFVGEVHSSKSLQDKEIAIYIEEDSPQSIPFSLAVNKVVGRNLTGNKLGKINWWKNELDGKYYFFLPSSADMQSLGMSITGAEGVYLDGNYIEHGSVFSVEPGEYQVETGKAGDFYSVVFMKSTNLSALYIQTEESEEQAESGKNSGMDYLRESKENRLSGMVLVVDADGNTTYQGEIEYIHGRGNATWEGTDKKSFALKLNEKAEICGMGEAKKWLMLPNCFDRSFLRNYLTYTIAQKINLPFTTDSVFVDWYVDGEYQGNYQLCEKIEIKEERIAIDDLEERTELENPEHPLETFPSYTNGENGGAYTSKGYVIPHMPQDISGGYLLELELRGRYQGEAAGFVTPNQEEVVISSPTYASEEQVNYISTFYEEMEAAILTSDGVHPTTGKSFTEYIDVESFAKKYIIEELSKNLDAGLSSQYFYKLPDAKGGKLFAGPVWDYDSAWGYGGSRYGVELSDPYTFYANLKQEESVLWSALYNQPIFYNEICSIYQNEVLPIVREEFQINADLYAEELEDSIMMNFYRWNIAEDENLEEKRNTFRGRVDSVKSFAEERMRFLEEEWKLK